MAKKKKEQHTLTKLGLFIKANGSEDFDMVMEFKYGLITPVTRENGAMARHMAMANTFTVTEMFIKANGLTTNPMVSECFHKKEDNMKDNGALICSTVKEKKLGWMNHLIKANTFME